jgi:O-antigen/teichoic acid export membrane protein
MSPEQLQSFFALGIGFAVAGLLATGYQYVTERPASFRLISHGPRIRALAVLPLVIFAAPFIIMRNTIRGHRRAGRRFEFVMLATMVAGFWSLMSGTLVMMLLEAVGQFLT